MSDTTVASVSCSPCGHVIWQGGRYIGDDIVGLPFGEVAARDGTALALDAQTMLTLFADQSCPRGGKGCPHTTAARSAAEQAKPPTRAELAARIADVDTQVDANTSRLAVLEAATPALSARVEQIGARGEEIGTRGEQIGTRTDQIGVRAEQIGARLDQVSAAHDSQLAAHTGQISTHDSQITTLTGQMTTLTTTLTALQARKPVVRISPATTLAAMTLGAVRDVTFAWPAAMPSTTYDVTTNDTRVTAVVKTRATTSAVLTLTATAAIAATTIVAVATGWA